MSHMQAQRLLREIVSTAALATWDALPTYDETTVDAFLSQVLPIIEAGQRQSVSLTDAFLAAVMGRTSYGLLSDGLTGAGVRSGTPPEEVYRRPFVNVWTALKKGAGWDDAVSAGRARVAENAEMDIALSSRATFGAAQEIDDGIYGYQRIARPGACKFCRAVNGAYVKSAVASPLHNRCGCSLEPLKRPHPRATFLPSGETVKTEDYAIHHHGELGAYLSDPQYAFTTEGDLT